MVFIVFVFISIFFVWSNFSFRMGCFFLCCFFFLFFVFFENEMSKILELDMSSPLILLCVCLMFPILVVSHQHMFINMKNLFPFIIISFYIVMAFLLGKSYFSTYMLYEMSALPILFIIISAGSSKKRGEASMYLLMFTVSSAMILFLLLFLLSERGDFVAGTFFQNTVMESGSHSLKNLFLSKMMSMILIMGVFLTFFVKFPSFFLHIWLPKAHVESPVMGSMLLAGILLKLGGFGIYIFSKFLLLMDSFLQSFLVSYVLWGGVLMGLLCYRQKDTKILIALSSVNHMSLVIVGLILLYSFCFLGSVLIMVGHGLFSSGLFYFSSLNYTKSSNRSTYFNKFAGNKYLGFSFILLILILLNGGFPPFINFLGELLILLSMMLNPYLVILFFLNFVFSGLYAITLLSNLTQKKFLLKNSSFFASSGGFFNYFVFYLHIFPVYVFFQSWIFF